MDEVARQAAMSDLYGLAGHLLWRAAARVGTEVDRILPGRADIHSYATLLALTDAEPQTQSSLARLTGVSGTTMTTVALALQREGLAARVRNPEDRRSYSLTRTAAGRSAVADLAPQVARLEHRLTASVSPSDAERLRSLLRSVLGDQLDEHMPRALLDSTGFLVTKAHQRTHREFATALLPVGIEPRHYGALRALLIVGPVTQGELAQLLDVSPATVVAMVDDLEARGLLSRERDVQDRRVSRLHLSPEASTVVENAGEVSTRLLEDRLGGRDSVERHDLVRLLRGLLLDTAGG